MRSPALLFALLPAALAGFASRPACAADSSTNEPGLVAEPLAPPSGPRGDTLFVILPAESTGVRTENNYADPDMWGRRYRELEVGAIGTGVAIGDYDGDGRPDLFVVSKTESCRLFRNRGDFRFEDVTEAAGVADTGEAALVWKQGATFADVNNDGRLDLYVCRSRAPNLLYLNQGDGTFIEAARSHGLDVTDACGMAAFGDYDRDGWLDVFIQTSVLDAVVQPDGRRDYLFHNNGDGTFTDVTTQAGVAPRPSHGNSAVWWDYDADGWPDLYVANDFAAPDALYRNNRDGTFTDVIANAVPQVPYSSMGADAGDIDNDGRLDFIATDMAATSHVTDQRTMAETRARQTDRPPGSGEVLQFPRNAVFLNTGAGRFLEAAHLAGLAATDWTWSVRWADLDNDGRLDLHVTNGMHREIHNVDLIARRMSAENEAARIRVMRASPVFAQRHLAFRNCGDLRFEESAAAWGLDQQGVGFGAAFGDLDGDGDLDLLYSSYQEGVTLLRNDSASGHRVIVTLRGTRSNRFGIGAKVRLESESSTQTRELTLARGYLSSSEPVAHFGLGADTMIDRLVVSWPSGSVQVFENLPANHRYVITETVNSAGAAPPRESGRPAAKAPLFEEVSASVGLAWTAREDAFDELAGQNLLPQRFNRRGPRLAVGDLDGSGRTSVIIGGTTRDPLRVLVPDDNGKYTPVDIPDLAKPGPVNDGPLVLFDVRGEGRLDLLVTRGGANQPAESPGYQPRLWLNDGTGHFRAAPEDALPPLPISAGAAAAADFDRDGRTDVFIGGRLVPGAYPHVPRSALLANRGGTFEDVTESVAPTLAAVGMVTGAVWSDVDRDRWPDLLLALDWGEVKYFHNRNGEGFDDWTERAGFAAAGTGWWRAIAAGEFNGDDRPDFVVGNVGLNTAYQASADQPVLLFAGDFTGRGTLDLIEGHFEAGVLYPRRSRRELAAVNRFIMLRFPRNDAYARASLPEIVGQDKLDAAIRLTATELRSGVFLSQPDGTHRFTPLPRIAQIAPINDFAVADFDGDGHSDIYAVQNTHAPAPAIGPFAGGVSQLLRGDGKGKFTAVPPAESGLVVPGDAYGVAVLDFDHDGRPDLVVTQNNNTTLAFRNAGADLR